MKIFPIPKELLDNACVAIERKNQRLPFSLRGITIDRILIQATLEILNAEPLHTLPQNCRNDIREKTPDGLDRRIKDYLGTDLRTANIVTDILETSGIARSVQVLSPSTGRDIKGTQLLNAWTWISDNVDHQSVDHKMSHDNAGITEPPKSQDFQTYLESLLKLAENEGKSLFIIESGDLHRQVGGYPGPNHRMPICCEVMYSMMQQGDQILYAPPKGRGASLKIQYQIPRTGVAGTPPRPRAILMDRASHQPMQNIPFTPGQSETDFHRSAIYCSDLLMVKLNAGDIASAIKYASDLVTYSNGEIRQAAKELVDQLEIRMESGLDEIPVELITKADRIAHKVKLGFGTM
ncbi:MAG: hypothetical protein NTZ24_15420 [Deltaproteobacteria bacterium]|nr:hypothetical protein [Deltaproteobacteria bacterium]